MAEPCPNCDGRTFLTVSPEFARPNRVQVCCSECGLAAPLSETETGAESLWRQLRTMWELQAVEETRL